MDENKEVHRIEVINITPQDISAKNILEEYIISRNHEEINKKTTGSSKIL